MMTTAGLINNDFVRRLEKKLQSAGRSSSYGSFGIRKWVDAMSLICLDYSAGNRPELQKFTYHPSK
jgi:hypothetical protein